MRPARAPRLPWSRKPLPFRSCSHRHRIRWPPGWCLRSSGTAATPRVGLDLMTVKFTNFEAVAKIFGNLRRAGIVAVGFTPSYTLIARRREVVEAALRNRLALIGHRSEWAEVGALMTYGAEVADAQRRSARIADRILKGVKPAAIPVERSTKTELVVNQRTAKTLGVTIPGSVVRRADRVCE